MINRRDFLLAASAAPLTLLDGAAAQSRERIWAPPARASLILKNGPEGVNRRPKPPLAFLEEDLGGTNPKMKVQDAAGIKWNVKWSEEVHSETFASRLAAVAGYFVRTTYYLPTGRITGCHGLTRAGDRIGSDGSFESAVFKLIPEDQPYLASANWTWGRNPFLATPEGRRQLNGLKIMLMLTSNWDGKDARDVASGPNTAIYEVNRRGGVEHRYAFDDWGGSMGRWGNPFTRSKWDPAGYAAHSPDFVQGVDDDGFVRWGYSGVNGGEVKKDISSSDVAWLLRTIGKIEDRHLAAALADAGADNLEVETFAGAIRARLTQLEQVAVSPTRQTSVIEPRG